MPRPGPLRQSLGVIALLVAATIAVALFTQISDQIHQQAFLPAEYFSYFTVQTSIANMVVLTVAGLHQLQSRTDSLALICLRHWLVAYAVVTGLVYNVLLRDLPAEPGGFVSTIAFPNEVLHVVIPVYLVVDWIFSPHSAALPWRSVARGLVYPLAWLVATLIRGDLTGWYPYAFLNPGNAAGWFGVGSHALGIALFVSALLTAGLILNRLYCQLRSTRATMSSYALSSDLTPGL